MCYEQLLGCSKNLLAKQLLGCPGQLIGSCNAVARVFWVVARELLCSFLVFWVVARKLCGC